MEMADAVAPRPETRPRQGRHTGRQACNICKDRKVRCDRADPKCGRCTRLRYDCSYDKETNRNPSQSEMARQIQELRERLAMAEARLAMTTPLNGGSNASILGIEQQESNLSMLSCCSSGDGLGQSGIFLEPGYLREAAIEVVNDEFNQLEDLLDWPGYIPDLDCNFTENTQTSINLHKIVENSSYQSNHTIEGAIRAEELATLHAVYFETFYPSLPILSRHRFLTETIQKPKSLSSWSLIYAVGLVGATVSLQYQTLQHACYRQARSYLDKCEVEDGGDHLAHIDTFQALVLVIRYEIMSHRLERAWITLGRAVRLAKMLNLHRLDQELPPHEVSRLGLSLMPTTDSALLEERRRSFWALYILESYASTRTGMPCQLGDAQTFHTRLPTPGDIEDAPTASMPFFKEAVPSLTASITSYASCILMVELALTCFDHCRTVETCESDKGFWDRHYSLVKNMQERNNLLAVHMSAYTPDQDPCGFSCYMNMCSLEILVHETAFEVIIRQGLPTEIASLEHRQSVAAAERIFRAIQLNWPQRQSENDLLCLQATFIAWPITMALKALHRDLSSLGMAYPQPFNDKIRLLLDALDYVECQEGYWHSSLKDITTSGGDLLGNWEVATLTTEIAA